MRFPCHGSSCWEPRIYAQLREFYFLFFFFCSFSFCVFPVFFFLCEFCDCVTACFFMLFNATLYLKKKKENGKRNKSQITQRRRVQSKWTNKVHGVFFFVCLACLTNSMLHFEIEGREKGKKKSWLLL